MSLSDPYFSNLYDLVSCMTKAVDLISLEVSNHHQQVAYLSYALSEKLQLPLEEKQTLVLSALLHDIGALSYHDRLDIIEEGPQTSKSHAYIGARLLCDFAPLKNVAEVIHYHHIPWDRGAGRSHGGERVPILSHVVHLADRVVVQIDHRENIISQINRIRENIKGKRDTIFVPEQVDAFLDISQEEALWLELTNQPFASGIPDDLSLETLKLTLDEVVDLTGVFARIIDFRSPFTARHSAGVAATAEKLAELAGFSLDECKMMNIAGNLHDIGKLAVPREIIEKQEKLEPAEFDIIRSHTFYTYNLLSSIRGFEVINQWASYHHEKLNGTGYPFHIQANGLSLGSRIMAVADIFTAITEDRPYRKGMSDRQTGEVLGRMVENGSISGQVVSLLLDNYQDITQMRREAALRADSDYQKIMKP